MASVDILQSRPHAFSAEGHEESSQEYMQASIPTPYKAPKFDPEKHMWYAPPERTITLAELNLNPSTANSPVAITTPFPLLTEEGVHALRADIFRPELVSKFGSLKYPGVYRVRGYGPDAPFTYAMWRSEIMVRISAYQIIASFVRVSKPHHLS
jgi:hypothetical protein